ncbi:excisionase family DNA-binding protein [Stenotrophomonas riyadhensis]|uniref:excisionase family DNA-binding protein n=1 Tax=Stenotrophomonas TaxID=40323 RepID=UPI0019550F25|nr:excisionase family DNA-binding protein [Stenotrophomonas maltophilia]
MTVAEAAEQSTCSAKTIRRAIDSGRLTAVRLRQRAKSDRIHREDLEAWWRQCRLRPAAVPIDPYVTSPHRSIRRRQGVERRPGISAKGNTRCQRSCLGQGWPPIRPWSATSSGHRCAHAPRVPWLGKLGRSADRSTSAPSCHSAGPSQRGRERCGNPGSRAWEA